MILLYLIIGAAYFAPTLYLLQKKPSVGRAVFVGFANFLLGWTIIGWFMVVRMALTAPNHGSTSLPRYEKK